MVRLFVGRAKIFPSLSWCCHGEPHQTLDELLQLLLGLLHRLLGADHSDELLVFVVGGGEDDSGSGAVANLADVATTFADEELVVLWLRT